MTTGRVDFTCMGMSAALGFIRDGQLILLAVSSAKRSSALPDVPTTLEAGPRRFRLQLLDGNVRPAEDPRAIIDQLYRQTEKALYAIFRA